MNGCDVPHTYIRDSQSTANRSVMTLAPKCEAGCRIERKTRNATRSGYRVCLYSVFPIVGESLSRSLIAIGALDRGSKKEGGHSLSGGFWLHIFLVGKERILRFTGEYELIVQIFLVTPREQRSRMTFAW